MADDKEDVNLLSDGGGGDDFPVLELSTDILPMADDEFDRLMSGDDAEPAPKPKTQTAPPPKDTPAKGKETPAKGKTTTSKAAPPAAPELEAGDIESVDDISEFLDDDGQGKGKGKATTTGEEGGGTDDGGEELDDETARIMFSNTYRHLVNQGIWNEVEGEGFDPDNMTPEVWAQVAIQQATETAHAFFDELVDRTGKYRNILDHAMRNGDPEDIINLFKEERYNDSLDLKQPADQKEIIRRYHINLLEWDKDTTESFINKAEADNELEKYATLADKQYKKHFKSQLDQRNMELKAREDKAAQDRLHFVETMTAVIDDTKLSNDKKQFLKKSLFTSSVQLSPTRSVTPFQAAMLKMQQNPQEYLDLIRFVMDRKAYLEAATAKKDNNTTQSAFRLKLNSGGSGKSAEIPAERQKTRRENPTELRFFRK